MMDSSRRIRVFFYMIHVLIEQMDSDENSTFDAAMLTVFGNKTRRASVDFPMIMKGLSLFGQKQILPIRFSSWHVVLLGTRNFVLQRVVPFTVQTCEALGAKKPCFHIHQLDDEKGVEKLQEELQAAGFGLEGLPKVGLDGLWTIGCFKCWIDSRIRTERRMYSSSSDASATAPRGADAASTAQDEDDALEEQQRKRRQLEAAYARRKRARRKINFKVLQDEIRRHQAQKQELLQTEQKLQQLLEKAKRAVRLHASQGGTHLGQKDLGQKDLLHDSDPSTLDRTNHSVDTSTASSRWLQASVPEVPRLLDPRMGTSIGTSDGGRQGTDTAWLVARERHQPITSYASLVDPLISNQAGAVHLGQLFPSSVLPTSFQFAGDTRQAALLYDPLSQGPGQLYRATLTGAATVYSPSPPYSVFDQAPSRADLMLNALLASRSAAAAGVPPYGPGDSTRHPSSPQDYAPRDQFRNYYGP
jgi:hypothetical protein